MKRLGLTLAFVFLGLAAHAIAEPFNPFAATGIEQKPDTNIPLDGLFKDETGQPATLRELGGGKPILLVPVLHNCPNICGVTLSGLMEAVQAQSFRPPADFTILAFGIDPREGPKEAKASLDELRRRFPSLARRGIHALTGTAGDIHAVTDALGYRYAWDPDSGQYAHDAAIAVLTPDGKLSHWLYGLAPESRDLKLALTDAGEGLIGNWSDQLLLLCYHYDPITGLYSPWILMALRTAGGLSVLAGGGLLAFALLRERRSKNMRGRLR